MVLQLGQRKDVDGVDFLLSVSLDSKILSTAASISLADGAGPGSPHLHSKVLVPHSDLESCY